MKLCSLTGCDRPHKARGLCAFHYERWLRGAAVVAGPSQDEPYSLLCECPWPAADPERAYGQCFRCYRKPLELMAPEIQDRYRVLTGVAS